MANWYEGSGSGYVDSNPKGSIEDALLTAKTSLASARKVRSDLFQELIIDLFQTNGEP